MTSEDIGRFGKIMTMLGVVFNEEISDARIEVYYEALADLSIDDLEASSKYIIRHSRFFPKPAELAQTVDDERDCVAELSFHELKREIGREGWTGRPELPSETLEVILILWGSWRALCETLPADGPGLFAWEKRFKETYQSLQKRKEFTALRESVQPKQLPS